MIDEPSVAYAAGKLFRLELALVSRVGMVVQDEACASFKLWDENPMLTIEVQMRATLNVVAANVRSESVLLLPKILMRSRYNVIVLCYMIG